ncbi:MAG: hypothetical protein E6G34_06365 [Actinobacteria bacterium]|nr:MAG: hypothetical protein E6G34_06365 [Actinomycetota bacterium]
MEMISWHRTSAACPIVKEASSSMFRTPRQIVPEDVRHTFVLGDLELDRDRGPKYALASAISGIP